MRSRLHISILVKLILLSLLRLQAARWEFLGQVQVAMNRLKQQGRNSQCLEKISSAAGSIDEETSNNETLFNQYFNNVFAEADCQVRALITLPWSWEIFYGESNV